jgi:hypothetical protein
MAHPLDDMLREHVAPVMRAAGFTRRGRRFWLSAESGTTALAEFYLKGDLGDGVTRFVVISGLLTGVEFADREREGPVPPGMVGTYMSRTRLLEPPVVAHAGVGVPQQDPVWGLWPERRQDVVDLLAAGLQRDATRLAAFVTDPQALVGQILAPNAAEIWQIPRPVLAVYVLVTEGRFDEALALAEAQGLRGPGWGKFATGELEALIDYWKSLGCRRAPGEWQKYVNAAE